MNTDEYTPNENQARAYYATTRNDEEGVPILEAFGEWSRFLARVRRDAAREALDGLIADKAHVTVLLHAENGGNVEDVLTHYRDTHYPEGAP